MRLRDSRRRRIALPMFTDFVLLDWAELWKPTNPILYCVTRPRHYTTPLHYFLFFPFSFSFSFCFLWAQAKQTKPTTNKEIRETHHKQILLTLQSSKHRKKISQSAPWLLYSTWRHSATRIRNWTSGTTHLQICTRRSFGTNSLSNLNSLSLSPSFRSISLRFLLLHSCLILFSACVIVCLFACGC